MDPQGYVQPDPKGLCLLLVSWPLPESSTVFSLQLPIFSALPILRDIQVRTCYCTLFSSLGKMPQKFLSLPHCKPEAPGGCVTECLEKPSFLGEVIWEEFLQEVIFYPSLKGCVGIRQLKNNRSSVLDRQHKLRAWATQGYSENCKWCGMFGAWCYVLEYWKTRCHPGQGPERSYKSF